MVRTVVLWSALQRPRHTVTVASVSKDLVLTLMGSAFGGRRGRMAQKTERIQFLRAVRQLRRIRSFYAAAMLLWAGSAAWSGWQASGGRQMWVSVLLLAVFTALFVTASVSLRRIAVPATGRPVHHAAPHAVSSTRRHAPA